MNSTEYILDDISPKEIAKLGMGGKAKKSQHKASTAAKSQPKDSTLDLVWTVFVSLVTLIGRLGMWCGRHIVGLAGTTFVVENLWLVQHTFHIFFK